MSFAILVHIAVAWVAVDNTIYIDVFFFDFSLYQFEW